MPDYLPCRIEEDKHMKAVVYTQYGAPDVLKLEEIEKPAPGDNEVLVRVLAASVNDWDWGLLRGTPFANRVIAGLFKPKKIKILGSDVAGRVERVGGNVKSLRVGDEVFGDLSANGFGGFAEYVCAPETALTLKPASLTFEEAAAVPQAAILALHALRYKGPVRPGEKILIDGAGGGAGTFAMQMAKSLGAEITGVDSAEKLEAMRSVGADDVIDYRKEDFTRKGRRYDRIVDFAAYHSILGYRRALSPGGVYVMVGGSTALAMQLLILSPLISKLGSKKMGLLSHKANRDLAYIVELIEAGKVRPVIDKRYRLTEVPEALRYFGEGHARGKVAITVVERAQ
jgi:NADPH:quinone reductase-like Zn-dependent oxidoreductase